MRTLDRKLLRDINRMKTQAVAIALVVASGTALFVGTATTSRALTLSKQRYYDDHRFADVWSHLARAPEGVVGRLAAIPGVEAVEGRLVAQGVVDLPTVEEPVSGLFVAIPPKPGHALNDIYIRRGRHVEANGADEALVGEAFAEKQGLRPGDGLWAVVAGRRVYVHLVGIAISPEFIMQIQPGVLVPDDRRFAVLWMSRDRLEELLDLRGAVNDVALRLTAGANERKVIKAVDRLLEPYGGQGAFGRANQPSHVMLEAHITPVAAMAAVVPAVFLAVAAFLVNVVLTRLVATERAQIGMLKAFGYGNARLARHYLLLACMIGGAGLILGLPAGAWLGRRMSEWFATFFRFPTLVFRVEPNVLFIAAAAMLGSSALGALGALRSVAGLVPTAAMAPPAPTYAPTPLDRLGAITRLRGPALRMIMRNINRHPLRALCSSGAMAVAIAIVVLGNFTGDAMDRVLDVQYQFAEHQDLSVSLANARSLDQGTGFEQIPGVRVAEPYRAVAARLVTAGRAQDLTIVGLRPSSRLRHIVQANYERMSVPPDGVVMSRWLAAGAGVRVGQYVALDIREGRRRVVTARVVGLVDEPLGTNAYMDLQALGRLLEEPNTFSAVNVLVDPASARQLYAALKRAPEVLGVEFRRGDITNFRDMGDDSVRFMRRIETLFAVIIAFGVVYNTARIALAERAYELATLRVLGFTRSEISKMLLGEIAALAAPAIPAGCALGYAMAAALSGAVSTELFRMPVVVGPRTYVLAIAVFAVAGLGSALIVRRRLDRLDMAAVLKARE